MTNLETIKYYPDRFYICLDGFDLNNLTTFSTDVLLTEQQSIFIHEYYHYLTNLTSYAGLRQFCLNFVDRYRCITNISVAGKLDAFPFDKNQSDDCIDLVEYYKTALNLLDSDDIDTHLVRECEQSPTGQFSIEDIVIVDMPFKEKINGKVVNGTLHKVQIHIKGLQFRNDFFLTFGAIDEFLSSSIDEYLFENDFGNVDPKFLQSRQFYPYRVLDVIFSFYGFDRPSAFEKILISYYSLNSNNPPKTLINVLKKIQKFGVEKFQENPEKFLLREIPVRNEERLLKYIFEFSEEVYDQGKIHISQALKYYGDKFYAGSKFKEHDFFYFIRPFFQRSNDIRGKQRFLLDLSRIINQFVPPIILKDNQFHTFDKLTNYGESTSIIIATYEIFESIRYNRIAKRSEARRNKYTFPDGQIDCDDITKFEDPPIFGTWKLALNELGLYRMYLIEAKKI